MAEPGNPEADENAYPGVRDDAPSERPSDHASNAGPDLDDLVGFSSASALSGRSRHADPQPETPSVAVEADPAPTEAAIPDFAPATSRQDPVREPGDNPVEPVKATAGASGTADLEAQPAYQRLRQRLHETGHLDRAATEAAPSPALSTDFRAAQVSSHPLAQAAPQPSSHGALASEPRTPQSPLGTAMGTPPARTSAPPPQPQAPVIEGQTGLFGLYTLILLIVPTVGVSGILAILVILGRSKPNSSLARSHDTYQRRTLWIAAGVGVVGVLLMAAPFALGPLTLFGLAIWVIVRGAYGLWMLKADQPIPRPNGLWI